MKYQDRFFSAKTCARCHGTLAGGRIMSMYTDEAICMRCKDEEMLRKDYEEARSAEARAVKAGDRNFRGIGWR